MAEIFAETDGIKTYHITYLDEKGTKFAKARLRIFNKHDICPICKEEIKKGGIILLINIYKLFPNVIIHADCCNSFSNNKEVIEFLRNDFNEAEKRKCWFNNI